MSEAGDLQINFPSTNGALRMTFKMGGVLVSLPHDDEIMVSWSDWEHVAKVYGKPRITFGGKE
jgi:hypothetical protein